MLSWTNIWLCWPIICYLWPSRVTSAFSEQPHTINSPFYYISPRFEGFGAKYLQLKAVYYGCCTQAHRPLFIVSSPNKWHYPDLGAMKISLCDIIDFDGVPISCVGKNPVDILTQNECVVQNCEEGNWYCKPSAYMNTAKIYQVFKVFSNFRHLLWNNGYLALSYLLYSLRVHNIQFLSSFLAFIPPLLLTRT